MSEPAIQESAAVKRDPVDELENLLLSIAKSVIPANYQVSVSTAKGPGFAHFEVRCAEEQVGRLKRLRDPINKIMLASARARRIRYTMNVLAQPGTVTAVEEQLDLEKLLGIITRSLVDDPDQVVVIPAPGDGFVHYEVRCEQTDVGALVGSRGSHAEAIRAIMERAGELRDSRVSLHIMGRDGGN